MVTTSFNPRQALVPISLLGLVACGSGGTEPEPAAAAYSFTSRFVSASSVDYQNQVKRQLLVSQLSQYLEDLDDQSFNNPTAGDVTEALRFHYRFASDGGNDQSSLPVSTKMPAQQRNWGDLGGVVDLEDKMPEPDLGYDQPVIGYEQGLLPQQVLGDMFGQIEALIIARAGGNIPTDPDGTAIEHPYLSAQGFDYRQLTTKFLLGAVAYSQGTADYLADDRSDKGLNSPHATAATGDDGAKPYSELEHAWDEAFGYFGFARDFTDYSGEEAAANGGREDWQGYHDSNTDGQIDLGAEYNFGHAVNTAKRDSDANANLGKDAFDAFVAGRKLLAETEGELDDATKGTLRGHRDEITAAWERTIVATAIHYINEVQSDVSAFGSPDYVFADHAKHWSELKGFALILQFNPQSKLSTADLTTLHDEIGTKPVLPNADATRVAEYQAALSRARELLQQRMGFTTEQANAW